MAGRSSSSFSSCSAFSSNPTQRNLRMSLTISLDAAGVCFAGISMIVLALVLAFIALCAADVAASNVCRARVIYLLKRKFLLKTFVVGQCGATYESVSLLRCVFGKEFDLKAATAPRIPHGELSVADEQLWRVTKIIRARRVSGNGIVGEVHRSQSTNRLG